MEDNRKPIYSKDQQSRVVSVANGQWQLQGHWNLPGTATFDPWFKRGAPCTRDEALKAMGV